MELPVRKSPRIPGFDYSRANYYFITICTHNKVCMFGMGQRLTPLGAVAAEELLRIPERFPGARVDKSVVMPNHIHAIIDIHGQTARPNLNVIVGQYKSGVTRRIHTIAPGMPVWQRSYHDHVIRNEGEYKKIWAYIDANPRRWAEDCFFQPPPP